MKEVTLDNVAVSLGNTDIVEGVSFTVPAGKITMILGPNGSGKTTLLKAIMGLVPYTGEILVDGKKIEESGGEIGYVPQKLYFDRSFPITVMEFMGLAPHTHSETEIIGALREVEMAGFEQKLLGKLSGGQLQRVLIARAILHQPKLLIFDEPTSGIDAEGIKDFYQLVSHLNRDHGVTILMVSHEIDVVESFADQVVCLNKTLCCVGSPKKELAGKALEALYGTSMITHTHKDHV